MDITRRIGGDKDKAKTQWKGQGKNITLKVATPLTALIHTSHLACFHSMRLWLAAVASAVVAERRGVGVSPRGIGGECGESALRAASRSIVEAPVLSDDERL